MSTRRAAVNRDRTRREFGLRAHLLALSLALLLPSLGLGAAVAWRAAEAYRTASRARMQDTARALALSLDRQIEQFKATLVGLTASRQLDGNATESERADFFRSARAIGDALGTSVVQFGPGPDYQMLVNTRLPYGAALPAGRSLPVLEPAPEVFETGRPAIGGVALRDPEGRPESMVIVPVERQGRVVAALGMPLDAGRIQLVLHTQHLSGGLLSTVTDSNGRIVARSADHDRAVGHAAASWYLDATERADLGFASGPWMDGVQIVVAFAHVPAAPGWTVNVNQPVAAFAADWQRPLVTLAIGGAIVLALGMILAALVARRLVRPVAALAGYAEAVAKAQALALPLRYVQPFSIREYEGLRLGFAAAESALQALADRERRLGDIARSSEAALAESEARFARAIGAARIATWEWDVATDAITGSNGREVLFGMPPGTVPTLKAVLAQVHPDDVAVVVKSGGRATRGENDGAWEAEFRVIWPDGSIHWLRLVGRADFASDGSLECTSGVLVDVTDRREAEDALARLNRDLTVQVEEEIGRREAAQVRAALSERMQALGQLAGGIAHDFNNVLQGIQGAAAIIERRPDDRVEVRRLAKLVLESSGRGASVTRRLLTFARQGDLCAEPVDVAELLAGMRGILTPALGSPISVRVDLAAGLPPLLADKSQLETALLNLATNARDAMSDGGILTFSAIVEEVGEQGCACPTRLSPGRYVRLSVTDNGSGIDAETRNRVYEPFFTTKPVGKGTGLGLPMVKGFVEQSGGGMHLVSEPGRGTAVLLWLPEATGDLAELAGHDEGPLQASAVQATGARVLLVDDDDLVRDMLAAELADAGYAVVAATGAREALALVDGGAPVDVLVTDLSMPEMDGLGLIAAVQARRPGLPTVLLTGYAGDAAALAQAGATSASFSLLQKPITGKQLLARVAVLLALVRA